MKSDEIGVTEEIREEIVSVQWKSVSVHLSSINDVRKAATQLTANLKSRSLNRMSEFGE